MAAVVRIELANVHEARDLVAALARRGLTGRIVRDDGRCDVEVAFAREDPRRLAEDVTMALERWLLDNRKEEAVMRTQARRRVVRAPRDRPACATLSPSDIVTERWLSRVASRYGEEADGSGARTNIRRSRDA
jgi:hypothetical protein